MILFSDLPPELAEEARAKWSTFRRAVDTAGIALPDNTAFVDTAKRVFFFSDFVFKRCLRRPELLPDLIQSGDLERRYFAGHLKNSLRLVMEKVGDEADLMARLRRFRTREMVRIAWRDLGGQASAVEVMADLSSLAEAVLDIPLAILMDRQVSRLGPPVDGAGRLQQLVVIGMGKLGAKELNFSSDIDLVFAYPDAGLVSGSSPTTNFLPGWDGN